MGNLHGGCEIKRLASCPSRVAARVRMAVHVACVMFATNAYAQHSILPQADGTIADGGNFGTFDGIPDAWDWFFNGSSYEGAITLTRGEQPGLEYRVVWEYNLAAVSAESPVIATLSFQLRGSTRFPAEPAVVHIYSYPADLVESASDFSAGPAVLEWAEPIEARQPATTFRIDVSRAVSAALSDGTGAVGFRFQIDPETTHDSNQAFMDVLEAEPNTKPLLTVTERVPGDYDGDRDVDMIDFSALTTCLSGPGSRVSPACAVFDFDADADVDLEDLQSFEEYYSEL